MRLAKGHGSLYHQPIIMSLWSETFKTVVSSIKVWHMKPVTSLSICQLPRAALT